MDRLVMWILFGALLGALGGYLFRTQQHLQPHQSRLRWIPALLIGGDVPMLLRVLGSVALGAAMGAGAGWIGWTGMDALTGA